MKAVYRAARGKNPATVNLLHKDCNLQKDLAKSYEPDNTSKTLTSNPGKPLISIRTEVAKPFGIHGKAYVFDSGVQVSFYCFWFSVGLGPHVTVWSRLRLRFTTV